MRHFGFASGLPTRSVHLAQNQSALPSKPLQSSIYSVDCLATLGAAQDTPTTPTSAWYLVMPRTATPEMHHRVPQVLVAGIGIPAMEMRHQPDIHQASLKAARQQFGHALCECQSPPLPLVIRERGSRLFLACWPGHAQQHALNCPFYSETVNATSLYAPGAFAGDGVTTELRLHHPLHGPRVERPKAAPARAPTRERESSARAPEALHLWGVLHHLWETAGMNRWGHGWSRDWGMLRHHIRRAAQSTMVDGRPLLESLYLPAVWQRRREEQIEQQWRDFTDPLFRHNRSTEHVATGIVIGVVRRFESTPHGYAFWLRQSPQVFFVDKAVAERMASYSRRGWAALGQMGHAKVTQSDPPTVVAALRIQASAKQRLLAVEAALMRVSRHFVPVDSSFEEQLVESLVADGRSFVKPLHYDLHGAALPDVVLADATREDGTCGRVAMHVYGSTIQPAQQARLERGDRTRASAAGLAFWKWDAGAQTVIPPLPPLFSSDPKVGSPRITEPSA